MSDMNMSEDVDPSVLQSLLVRHRTHLANTHKEINALKVFVKTLEGTNEGLRHEITQLKLELAHYKSNEERILERLASSEASIDRLTATVHKQNQDHANVIAEMDSQRRQMLLEHKSNFDRVCAQLEATQQPMSSSQPLPWKRIADIVDHPIHILREVVLEDQKREERVLQRNLPIVAGDNSYSGTDSLARLLSSEGDAQKIGHDLSTWWVVLKRIHQILKDRRSSLGIPANDATSDFFIRSRNALVAEWSQLHREITRGIKVVSTLRQAFAAEKEQLSSLFVDRQLDLTASILGDADTQCHRVKQSCFSDVDKLLYSNDVSKSRFV